MTAAWNYVVNATGDIIEVETAVGESDCPQHIPGYCHHCMQGHIDRLTEALRDFGATVHAMASAPGPSAPPAWEPSAALRQALEPVALVEDLPTTPHRPALMAATGRCDICLEHIPDVHDDWCAVMRSVVGQLVCQNCWIAAGEHASSFGDYGPNYKIRMRDWLRSHVQLRRS